MTLPDTLYFGDTAYRKRPSLGQMWQVKHLIHLPCGLREPPEGLRGYPEIFRFSPEHNIELTKERQLLWKEINPNMTGMEWRKMASNNYALTNGHGYYGPFPLRDYVNNIDLDADANPVMPFCYVMGGALLQEGRIEDGKLYPRYIDVNKPLPTAQQVMDEHLYYELVNVYVPSGSVGGMPVSEYRELVPLYARMPIWFPIDSFYRGLEKVDMSKALPEPYLQM